MLGSRIQNELTKTYYTVVGIVNSNCFVYDGMRLLAFTNSNKETSSLHNRHRSELYFKTMSGKSKEVRKSMKQFLSKYQQINNDLQLLNINEKAGQQKDNLAISGLFDVTTLMSLVCVVLSFIGIYSSIALKTEHRRKEVAIRKVNGAVFRDIFFLFGKTYLIILLISWSLASLLADYFIRVMTKDMSDDHHPSFPKILFYSGVLLIMVMVMILTIIYKINEVAKVNPAEVVKTD